MVKAIQQFKFFEKYHYIRTDRRKNILKNYSVADNHFFVAKADDLRWQYILKLNYKKWKLRKINPISTNKQKRKEKRYIMKCKTN